MAGTNTEERLIQIHLSISKPDEETREKDLKIEEDCEVLNETAHKSSL